MFSLATYMLFYEHTNRSTHTHTACLDWLGALAKGGEKKEIAFTFALMILEDRTQTCHEL